MATSLPTAGQALSAMQKQAAAAVPADGVAPCALTAWIEIYLQDMEGNPMPGRQFIVKTPEGKAVAGTLDQDGHTRLDGLTPGTCQVSFPEFDADAWERV